MKQELKYYLLVFLLAIGNSSCRKEFLAAKPSTNIVMPSSVADFQAILDNASSAANLIGEMPVLGTLSADEYGFLAYVNWQATSTNIERNCYIWATDIYGGQSVSGDWQYPYRQIYYANVVLNTLNNLPRTDSNAQQWNYVNGWAYFIRAQAYFWLVQTYSPAYDEKTAATDLGLPLRLNPEVDEIKQRSSVKETYDLILADLGAAEGLMGNVQLPPTEKNRPSKAAVLALEARTYLMMRKYDLALKYASDCLTLNSKLIDYNTVSTAATLPFPKDNDELIVNYTTVGYNGIMAYDYNGGVKIADELYNSYAANDLRTILYFTHLSTSGSHRIKYSYTGTTSVFSGLATDEVYLIKAECLARSGKVTDAMSVLNALLVNRFKTGTFIPYTATSASDALAQILAERKKELVFRNLRWFDLKRLNKEGANITLTRVLNGVIYTLPPNDPKYVMPIPQDEINLSGLQQNVR